MDRILHEIAPMHQWYFARHGQTRGPYTDEQLRALAHSGELLPDDLVSYAGAARWVPAREVPNLFPGASASPGPAPRSSPRPASVPGAARRSFLHALLGLPKPILFGIFGGVGGLLGALLLGELLWAVLSPASFRPQPEVRLGIPSSVRIYVGGTNRFVIHLAREGFHGPVQIEADNLPQGVHFSPATVPEDQDASEVEIRTDADLAPGAHTLTIRGHAQAGPDVRDSSGTFELAVEPPPAQLRLSVPPEVNVYRGGKTRFRIRLARHRFEGPVRLHFEGLPEPLELPDRTVADEDQEVQLTLRAPKESKLGEWTVSVVGAQEDGAARATAQLNLRVRTMPTPQADIVFVLDLTGSMQFAINGIRLGIQNFADQLRESGIDARIALVGFRDIQADRERPFVMKVDDQAFTTDYEAFKHEVGKLQARGGGDAPESSLQALALAAQQEFRPHTARVLLLITDAPPKIHHDETPSTVEETVEELRKQKIDQLHFVVRPSDFGETYTHFYPTCKGKVFDLTRRTSGDAFRDVLPELSRAISTTIAAGPRAPEEAVPLPPLPVESQALPAPAVEVAVVKAVQSTQAYTRADRYRLLLAIAVWTMAIAGCISLMIQAGQRFYTSQRRVALAEGSTSLGGGFLAGLVGGAAGQLLFQSTAGGTAWEVVSRLLGWGLLGGLIGTGMSFFVPNLKWYRGLAGGLVGGLLGAVAFVLISLLAGAFLGRWIGAGILGFFIGLMVALAEIAFRRYWLEIAFSPREVRTVTLGTAPVSLGGDERLAAVAVAGCPPVALRYWLDGERVLCEEVATKRTVEVAPGETRSLGKVSITLCGAAQGRKAGYTLELSNGTTFHLVEGLPLTAEDLPGLHPHGPDGVVALVSKRPNDPTTLLLRNRSKQPWAVHGPSGSQQVIDPGRGLELSPDCSISFGPLRGTLRRSTR